MKTSSMDLERTTETKTSYQSQLQKVLMHLLIQSGVEEDEFVGTMLMLKDSVQEQEEMLLYLWDNNPTPQQIFDKLVAMVKARK